jgi:uncharacterized RDD family membrane protein YckC
MAQKTPPTEEPRSLPAQVRSARPAGFFSRLEALVIDLVILSIVQLVGSVMIEKLLNLFLRTRLSENFISIIENSVVNIAAGSVVITLFVIAYFTFFWTLVGFTPGKAVLGLKVVRKNGSKVSFFRAFLRLFGYWISAIPFFLGFIWVLWDPNRQCWHDKIAGTQVIYVSKNLQQ